MRRRLVFWSYSRSLPCALLLSFLFVIWDERVFFGGVIMVTEEMLCKGGSMELIERVKREAAHAAEELVSLAHLRSGNTVVIGCSTSEIVGMHPGENSVYELAEAVFEGLDSVFSPLGIFIAAQCCEHLNRALIVERDAFPYADIVNVVPMPKAGGSFATAAYRHFSSPVALEEIRADGGLDIGGTLIGMHLKKVAVPLRLKQDRIGEAIVLAARVRPKFIGGERACYDDGLKDGYPEVR